MNIFSKRVLSGFITLILTLSILLSSLTSCNLFAYVADSKSEISENIQQSFDGNSSTSASVSDYLREWGLPKFDTVKFYYFERYFNLNYNYGDGLPSPLSHAADTALLFLEYAYDSIDINEDRKSVV